VQYPRNDVPQERIVIDDEDAIAASTHLLKPAWERFGGTRHSEHAANQIERQSSSLSLAFDRASRSFITPSSPT
jgi:hypothetical protein